MAIFRTKARAVELLGKGQIADLSTAISELWKNGYDAYASELGCDLYMPGYSGIDTPIFTLHDNGHGMTKDEILSKWIVLGTDSKAHEKSSTPQEDRFGLQERVPMGEKGIGRLSVSYLGSPMLMITKKQGALPAALFIDWRILDNYDLYVDEVEIPVELIDGNDINITLFKMVNAFLDNFKKHASSWSSEQNELENAIKQSLTKVIVPETIKRHHLNKFNEMDYHGTTFIVFEPVRQLQSLGDGKMNLSDDNPNIEIQRSLSGLFNIFVQEPNFTTSFKVRNAYGVNDIIDDFFSIDDFNYADHIIKGEIDDEGRFSGEIKVFNEIFRYDFKRPQAPGKTLYGPIQIGLGVVEGRQNSSMLSAEKYFEMDQKTDKFGGLYLYRDYFRVLPYGRPDYDFLGFEERRNKRAGQYFFSYRKMFGYISITRQDNRRLKDKAGREGLIDNEAYRQFKADLIALFIDIAKTYFKSQRKGEEGNSHSIQQKQIEEQKRKVLAAEKKKANKEKTEFRRNLTNYSKELDVKAEQLQHLHGRLTDKSGQLSATYQDYRELVAQLSAAKDSVKQLWLDKPRFSAMTEVQMDNYSSYCNQYDKVVELLRNCEIAASDIRKKFDVSYLRQDLAKIVKDSCDKIHATMLTYASSFNASFSHLSNMMENEEDSIVAKYLEDSNKIINSLCDREEYEKAIQKVSILGEEIIDAVNAKFKPFIEHASNLNFDVDDDYLVAWHKSQEDVLRQRLEETYDLAQLGISVEIIDHELNNYYRRINYSMSKLKKKCLTDPSTHDDYLQLKTNFQYLESNYKMLQPMYRSARRMKTEINGDEIYNDMKLFFQIQLADANIVFEEDDSFRDYQVFGLKSIFSSVFVNIINNAIYWLQSVNERKIKIEYNKDTEEILIMNSGEQIADRHLLDIFTLFFTRRKDGRGIGLYLAKRSLNSMDMDIYATNNPAYNKLGGACFVIKKYTKE